MDKKKIGNSKLVISIIVSFIFLFPLLWIILTSLKSDLEVRTTVSIFPTKYIWRNYIDAWNYTNFGRQFLNSIIMSVSVTIGQLITSALAGYAFARLNFKGKNVTFALVLATLIVPYQLLVLLCLLLVHICYNLVLLDLQYHKTIYLFVLYFHLLMHHR